MNKAKSPTIILLSDSTVSGKESLKEQLTEALNALGIKYNWLNYKNETTIPDSDIALFLDDGSQEILKEVRNKKIVPIVSQESVLAKEVEDFIPQEESGDGFIYEKGSVWHILATLIKAVENYKFPYDWKNIVNAGQKKIN